MDPDAVTRLKAEVAQLAAKVAEASRPGPVLRSVLRDPDGQIVAVVSRPLTPEEADAVEAELLRPADPGDQATP